MDSLSLHASTAALAHDEEAKERARLEGAAAAIFAHVSFTCDGCERSPIIGPRYHCQTVGCDFDLCQNCYLLSGTRPTNATHTNDHTFERILGPVPNDEEMEEEEEEEPNNLPPTNVNYEQLLREYLADEKKSEIKSDLLSSRLATELMWKSIKRITMFVLRSTRSPRAISAHHTYFVQSDPSRRGKTFPNVLNHLEESFIWNEFNGPPHIRKLLTEHLWTTILGILGQQLHEIRLSEAASGKQSYQFESQFTALIRFLPVFLSSILQATPNAKGIEQIQAARQQQAEKDAKKDAPAWRSKSISFYGVEAMRSLEEEKVDSKEEVNSTNCTTSKAEYHLPTVEEDAATFQFSVQFLPEFIQFLLTILVDLKYKNISGHARSLFHHLFTIRPFREWLFQSEGAALVDLILDIGFGLCEQPLRRLTVEEEALIKRIDGGETGLDDPRDADRMLEDEDEDGNPIEENLGIKYGQQLTAQLLGYAAETVSGADGHVTRQAIEKAFRILDRATQPATDGSVEVDQYEIRAAFFILRECLPTGAILTKAGTPVFSSNDLSCLMNYIILLLGRPTLGPIAFGAIRLFLARFKTMPLASLNVTELMAPLVGPTFQTAIQIMRDRTASIVLRRQYMMLIAELLQWLPVTTIKSDPNLIQLSMNCIEELLNTKSSPADLPPPKRKPAKNNFSLRNVDGPRNLLNPRIDGSRMNKHEHGLLYKCFFILRAAAMGQSVELKNEFTPYAPKIIELVMSASLHLPGLRTVFEMSSIQIWRCMAYEDALKLLPRYHQHLIHLMEIDDRYSTGFLSRETETLREACLEQWTILVEYFGVDCLPYVPDLVKYIKRFMHPKYGWAIETRPAKLARLLRKRQAEESNNDEVKEVDADEEKVDDDEAVDDDDDNDQDEAEEEEESEVSAGGEDEDENGTPIYYRTRYGTSGTFQSFLVPYGACCKFIGVPFRPYHEKELCPTLIHFLGHRGLVEELTDLVTVLPTLYGDTPLKRPDAIIVDHTFSVHKLSPTSKTLLRKVLEKVQNENLSYMIQWYQGVGADSVLNTYESLFYTFGTSVYDLIKPPPQTRGKSAPIRRTHIEFSNGGGYRSKSGKGGIATKSNKSTGSKKKDTNDPTIQVHEQKLTALINELIMTLINSIKRLSTAYSIYPQNSYGQHTDLAKYLRVIQQNTPDLLQEDEHVHTHHCLANCDIGAIHDLIGYVYRLLGTLFQVAGHWFATKYELIQQIHTINDQLVQYPVFRVHVLRFFGDQCGGLTQSKGPRMISDDILTHILQPAFSTTQATLRRSFNLQHHSITDSSAVLTLSDFIDPYAQLPHEFYGGTDVFLSVVDGLQQQIRLTYQRCQLYRARRQIEDPHQPFIEATLSSLSVAHWFLHQERIVYSLQIRVSLFLLLLDGCVSVVFRSTSDHATSSTSSSSSMTPIDPPETTSAEYPSCIWFLDHAAYTLGCLFSNRSLMKYCSSQSQLADLPNRIVLLFLCVLPLRIATANLNHIYRQFVRIARQAPEDLQDEPWLTLKTNEQKEHVRSISRFAARRHAHQPTLIEAAVLKAMRSE